MILAAVALSIFVLCIIAAYDIGYANGMLYSMKTEEEFNREFRQLIVDFVSKNYVKKERKDG